MNQVPGWQKLWQGLGLGEQKQSVDDFCAFVESCGDKEFSGIVWGRMAAAYNFRPQFILRLSPAKRRQYFLQRIFAILDPPLWEIFLDGYFRTRSSELRSKVLLFLKVGIDTDGNIVQPIALPDDETVRKAVADLEEEFSSRQLAEFFNFLILSDDAWSPIRPEFKRLQHRATSQREKELTGEGPRRAAVESRVATEDRPLYAEFTTLDRVLIDQIVATVGHMEGALTEDQLADLVDTVIALNTKRHRSYYHMGFMDTLLPEHDISLSRPEFNDLRKEWYLAGALAGFARQRNDTGLVGAMREHQATFQSAASKRGGAGASMARNLFGLLVELDRIAEASKLLAGQVEELGLGFAFQALDKATIFIRARNPSSAMPLLEILEVALLGLDDQSETFQEFSYMVRRRMGQCLQVQGDLGRAREIFTTLHATGTGTGFSELSGDLGLVEAGHRSLYEIRVPPDTDAQHSLVQGLERGRRFFEVSAEGNSEISVNCSYPLAVLDYLQYMHAADDAMRDKLRDTALRQVQQAISAIQSSHLADLFEREGILGQALFMQVVLQMDRLDPVDARSAAAAWNRITEVAGQFPLDHIKRLLVTAEMIDPGIARDLAESIWKYRQADAIDLLLESEVLVHSSTLQRHVADAISQPNIARAERWRLWSRLVPVCLKTGELGLAARGLDQMEELSEDAAHGNAFLAFLAHVKNYDPIWDEQEAAWSRIRVLRKLGMDDRCAVELRRLYFMVRDNALDEGDQVLRLFKEWHLPETQYQDLKSASVSIDAGTQYADSIEKRLTDGEQVQILFIGGNEIQARYDDQVHDELRTVWPGVSVKFVHTGWSANWGRDVALWIRDANRSDVVVLMKFMRTMLGRSLREALSVPWVSCAATGKGGVLRSVQEAARVAISQRIKV